MSSATFTQTRTFAQNLEKQTEQLLSRLSKIQTAGVSVEPSEEESSVTNSIVDMLEKREEVVGRLNRLLESDANISTSKLQQLQRHKEVLADHKGSFYKIQGRITEERNRNNLLFTIRSDISAHKQREISLGPDNENNYILDERARVDNANSFADRLLQQAYETRDELFSQRVQLQNAANRILGTLQSVPGINVLISKINTRRKRDTLIMGFVISLCIIGLFFLA